MVRLRKINRRSFLIRVAGGSAATGAVGLVSGGAAALQVTDRDPSDPVGRGRGGTGITDSDTGVGADPPGRGRGGGPRPGATGVTDRDPTDPVGRGRGGTGVTDRDTGTTADPVGRGRGGSGGGPDSLTDEQRRRRCQEESDALAELIGQSNRPEGWSDARLAEMRSTLDQINAVVEYYDSAYGGAGVDWRTHPGAVGARNYLREFIRGTGISRDATPPEMHYQLREQIRRAEAASAQRAELHRQMAVRRTNMLAFECDRYR